MIVTCLENSKTVQPVVVVTQLAIETTCSCWEQSRLSWESLSLAAHASVDVHVVPPLTKQVVDRALNYPRYWDSFVTGKGVFLLFDVGDVMAWR